VAIPKKVNYISQTSTVIPSNTNAGAEPPFGIRYWVADGALSGNQPQQGLRIFQI